METLPHFTCKTSPYRSGRILGKGAQAIVSLGTRSGSKDLFTLKKQRTRLGLLAERTVLEHIKKTCAPRWRQHMLELVEVYMYDTPTTSSMVLVMLNAPGVDLEQNLHTKMTMTPHVVHAFVYQLSHAVEHLHACQVVHRDIKMENIIFDPLTTKFTIIDFGNASIGDEDPGFIGTIGYISPEIVAYRNLSNIPFDMAVRGDVFALMVSLYLWLHRLQREPFVVGDTRDSLKYHIFTQPQAADVVIPGCDTSLVNSLLDEFINHKHTSADLVAWLKPTIYGMAR